MGFNSVYQNLKELFPQVDARILKAVAIEHSKDADGAVEAILTEVLPCINDQSGVPTSVVKNEKAVETSSQSSTLLESTIGYIITASEPSNIDQNMNSMYLNEIHDGSVTSSFYDAKDSHDHPNGNSKNEELIALASFADSLIGDDGGKDVCNQNFENHVSEGSFPSLKDAGVDLLDNKIGHTLSSSSNSVNNGEADVSLRNGQSVHSDCLNGLSSYDLNTTPHFDCHKEQPFLDCNSLECQDAKEETFVSTKVHARRLLDTLDLNHPEPASDVLLCHDENQETSSYEDAEFIQESAITDAVDTENETLSSTIVTRSGHICRINLLQDLIENSKTHKDDIFSAMESVVGLIKEVEFQEKAAEQAKEDAAMGGLKILEKVEELKKMLKHAKEANDMHAGEVYGEKSILATEVKELQTRLLGLSDEKDRSLSILDEMRTTLEARLAVAEEERRKAEQEIFEKEETARGALAEQEVIMDKVVQESKLLQQEAEENAKLRDFLMEKGRVVDILQGEISVIIQDVKSLKENFDNRITIGGRKSLSSLRQTSGLLSSSNSSVESVGSESDCGLLDSPSAARTTSQSQSKPPSVGSQTPRSSLGVGEDQDQDQDHLPRTGVASPGKVKELLDDDWELFDF